jgi:nucleotide-binding universal stress UspA family protein
MLNHILLPLDESELSERAVEFAQKLVAPDGKITLLTVVEVSAPVYAFSSTVHPLPISYEQLRQSSLEEANGYLHQILDRVAQAVPASEICVRSGAAAETIIEVALETEADAIVMSTHGRSGVSRWVFGSVTQKVLSAASCPVLVIPPGVDTRP